MPSMSFGFSPQSFIALIAASACRPICDKLVMTPNSVVSAAPTTATVLCGMILPLRRTEQWQGDRVVLRLEHHLQLHVELQGLGCLRAIDDVGHHARAFV